MFDVFRHHFLHHIHEVIAVLRLTPTVRSVSDMLLYSWSQLWRHILKVTQNSPCDSNLHETTPPRWSLFRHSAYRKVFYRRTQWCLCSGECVALASGCTRSSTHGVKLIHPPANEKVSGMHYCTSSHICRWGEAAGRSRGRDFLFLCPADIIIDIIDQMLSTE